MRTGITSMRDAMNLNECTVYAFGRTGLPVEQTHIQPLHAAFHVGMKVGAAIGDQPGIPFMIAKELQKLKTIYAIAQHCVDNKLIHYLMFDDQVDKTQPTAVGCLVTSEEQKVYFRKFPLRKFMGSVAATANADLSVSCPPNTPVAQAHLGNQGGRANSNADLAQLREHPVSNGEVVGENPAVSSNFNG